MSPAAERLIAVLPAYGLCTVRRAAYHAQLPQHTTQQAAAELAKAELLEATWDGRLTLSITPNVVLQLTDVGREEQARVVLSLDRA